MRNLWLVILVGLATEFSGKILVLSQLPSAADDLYLEGRTSGDLPIDDEDGEDDGSGSGSGDYVYSTNEAELLKILNSTKTIFGRERFPVEPFPAQPTADSHHYGPTTAAESQEPTTTVSDSERSPGASPSSDKDEEVPGTGLKQGTSSSVDESETTATETSIGSEIPKTRVRSGFDVSEKAVENEILAKDGQGSRLYEMDSPKEVTSENLWERTDVLAAVIACGVVGFLCAVFLLLLLAYRMKKKDEGSYDLGETKLSNTAYHKAPTKEFYA